jgi:ketosteroid isomerase-like protein
MDEILKAYLDATNTHEFDNVQQLLHPNALYWFTNRCCNTPEDIRAYFESAWETIKEENYWAEDVQWIHIAEDSAICVYTYHYEGYFHNEWTTGKGRATNCFVKEDGKWLLLHEHLSSF